MTFEYIAAIPIIIYVVYLVACLFIIITTFCFAVKLTKKIWQGIKYFFFQLQGDLSTKLISLSIVGFLIPFVIPTFINSIIDFFYSFITSFLNDIPLNSESILSSCELSKDRGYFSNDFYYCIQASTIIIISSFNQSLSRGFNNANIIGFPWVQFILFFSLWIFIAEIINYLRFSQNINDEEADSRQQERWVQKIFKNSVVTNNIIFFIILAMGLYLSFASIAAIPSLQDSQVTLEEV